LNPEETFPSPVSNIYLFLKSISVLGKSHQVFKFDKKLHMHFHFLSHEPKLPSYLQQQLFNTQFVAHVSVVQHSIEGGGLRAKHMGLKWGAIGNTLGDTHWEPWEHIGNLMGTPWEHIGNTLGIKEFLKKILRTTWEHIGNMIWTHWKLDGTWWEHLGNIKIEKMLATMCKRKDHIYY